MKRYLEKRHIKETYWRSYHKLHRHMRWTSRHTREKRFIHIKKRPIKKSCKTDVWNRRMKETSERGLWKRPTDVVLHSADARGGADDTFDGRGRCPLFQNRVRIPYHSCFLGLFCQKPQQCRACFQKNKSLALSKMSRLVSVFFSYIHISLFQKVQTCTVMRKDGARCYKFVCCASVNFSLFLHRYV